MLINLLILFFFLLIFYQIFLYIFGNVIEGMENQNDPNSSNAMILSQQNAGDIAYLKERLDELMDLKGTVVDVCGNVIQLNQQVQDLVQQQADAATELAGDTPLDITV